MNTTPNPKNISELNKNNLNQKTMNYKQLNDFLKDFYSLRNSGKRVTKVVEKEITDPNGQQGEEGVSYEVYKLPIEGVFLKLKITTNSNGDDERVAGAEFVTPKEKTVISYEPINQ